MRAHAHLHALMTQTSCAVGMRNAKPGNHLKVFGRGKSGDDRAPHARDLSARFKVQKKQNKYGGTKIITYQVFFSCLSEIGSKQKLSFGRQLLSNSVCVQEKHFLELNARNSRLEFPSVWRSILSAIAISNNLKTTGFHHTDRL